MWFKEPWRPDKQEAVPFSAMMEMSPNENQCVADILGPNGSLSTLPGMAFRLSQHRMAQMVAKAFELRKTAIIEAETGTGKSIAALVPAILHAMRKCTTVVVATATNSLLDQYANKDLPFLSKHLGPALKERFDTPFRWAVLKGRTNYACIAKPTPNDLFQDATADEYDHWIGFGTNTGDLSELSFDIHQPKHWRLKSAVTADGDECFGPKLCPCAEDCFFYRAKAAATKAHIVVTNHAVVALDLLLGGQALLPHYDGLVIDEAHNFASYQRNAMSSKLTAKNLRKLAGRLQQDGLEYSAALGPWIRAVKAQSAQITEERAQVFGSVLYGLKPAAKALIEGLERAEGRLAISSRLDAPSLVESCANLRRAVESLFSSSENRLVMLEEDDGERFLSVSPVLVASFLSDQLKGKPFVFTSATLATSSIALDKFKAFKTEVGINGCPIELSLGSPFDWNSQALYVFPRILTDADVKKLRSETYEAWTGRWCSKLWPFLKHMLTLTQGGAFVLCTSKAVAKELHRLHLMELQLPAEVQGTLSQPETIAWFKRTEGSVLYATSSYWEGVDVPGDSLRMVVTDRIPFPNTSDPLEAAIERSYGSDSFELYQLPYAITKLRQAMGRLIRTPTDRGILVNCDPRFHSRRYGRQIAAALPGRADIALTRRTTDVRGWLAGYSPDSIPPLDPHRKQVAADLLKMEYIDNEMVAKAQRQLREVGTLPPDQWNRAEDYWAILR